ncbi:MAG: multiheme c-type cytochrome, partial [Shewanella sp.]
MMKTTNRSQWVTLTPIALAIGLMTGCSDGDDGKEGPPGAVSIAIAQAASLKATIENVTIDSNTQVQVDFFLSNANGVAVTGLETLTNIDTLGVGIAKLAPPQPHYGAKKSLSTEVRSTTEPAQQWTSYINKQVEPATNAQANAATQWQAGIESSCKSQCLTALGNGQYRYTFSKPLTSYPQLPGLDTQYAKERTHRVYLELKPLASSPIDTHLINTVYDFIPATGQGASDAQSRTLIAPEQACFRCHNAELSNSESRLVMHGNKRFAFEGCVMCHTSYSGDPETANSLDMATLTHQIHQAKYQVVGYKGTLYDFTKVTYPGDMQQCQQCHIPGATAQTDNYHIPSQTACLDCHNEQLPADWNGTVAGLFHDRELFANAWALSCSGCHPDSNNPQGVGLFHNAKTKTAAKLANDYQVKLLSSNLNVENHTLEVTLQVQQLDQLPAAIPAIQSFWLIATGNGDNANPALNNGQRKVWNLLGTDPNVSLRLSGANQLHVTISQLASEDFGELTQTQLYSKLVLCADKHSGFALTCESANQHVSLGASNSITLSNNPLTPKAKADEDACRQCHDNGLADRVIAAHNYANRFEPTSSCGTCHAPQTATALTDGQCRSCHTAEAVM